MWVVTGGNGQLGQALSRQLEFAGIRFIALTSNDLDITNKVQVENLIADLEPKVVINSAAWTDVDAAERDHAKAFSVNQYGVANLVGASRKSDSIFVQISTDYVFSGLSSTPISEESQLNPINIYGHSKAAGEREVLSLYPEKSYIVRTSWLYSAYGKNFVKTFCNIATNLDGSVSVVTDQIGQPTNADDLAKQLIALVFSKASFGVYHGSNSGETTWFNLAQEIFQSVGANTSRLIPVTSEEYPRVAKRPQYSVLGHDKWLKEGLTPMEHWKISLEKSLMGIIDSIERKND